MIYILLVVLGLAGGSFINALVWRLHEQHNIKKRDKRLSIIRGRSMCPNCKHDLSAKDLVPLFSWLYLRGRCHYCHKPIKDSPLVELTLPLVFIALYVWWPHGLASNSQKELLVTWLACSVGLLALLVYDLRWMLLPNRIIYPTLALALIGRFGYIFSSPDIIHNLWLLAASVLIASGFFWLLFEASDGKWIGFGDVRLGLITGTLLADPKLSLLMLFGASLLGLAAVLLGLAGRARSFGTKIAFGPFLIAAAWLAVLFGQPLADWYQRLLS